MKQIEKVYNGEIELGNVKRREVFVKFKDEGRFTEGFLAALEKLFEGWKVDSLDWIEGGRFVGVYMKPTNERDSVYFSVQMPAFTDVLTEYGMKLVAMGSRFQFCGMGYGMELVFDPPVGLDQSAFLTGKGISGASNS